MELKAQINSDFIQAMKDKNEKVKMTLRMLKSKITEAEKKSGSVDLTDAQIVAIIGTYGKQLNDTINQAPGTALATSSQAELEIIAKYLPKQMTEDEIREKVMLTLDINNPKQTLGIVMSFFKTNYAGQYDAKVLKSIVDECLN